MKQKDEFEKLQYAQGMKVANASFARPFRIRNQGIGAQVQPFETFSTDFKRDNGIEAQINFALHAVSMPGGYISSIAAAGPPGKRASIP
jgi:hypothetical protein